MQPTRCQTSIVSALPLLRLLIRRAPLPLANGQHQNDDPLIFDAVHQTIAGTAQFDLVAVLHTVKRIVWHLCPVSAHQEFQGMQTVSTVKNSELLPRFRPLLNAHLLHQPQLRQ